MNVLIVGSGRVGATLAGMLDDEGHAVTVVDVDRASFAHLPATFKGTTHLGNGVDLDVLRTVGAERADAVLAFTQGDNRNLMAAQIAKEIFGVKKVFAKVNDPIRAQIYRAKGIVTVSRTTVLAVLVHGMLMGQTEVGEILLQRANALEREMAHAEATETVAG
ncbi:MAG: TrkA family potassium uptake protein [Chloroflexi bacterium]|nr:TrkA family potassium uptake protein [Chloroflexota bacterium]